MLALLEKQQAGGGPKSKRVLSEVLAAEKQRYQGERKRLKEEIVKLQQAEKALVGKTLERVFDALLEIDPDVANTQNQQAMKAEGLFLTEVGFNSKKYADHKLAKQKKS